MNILVTGGTGYIGSHVCVALLKAGYGVVAADSLANSRGEVAGAIGEIAGKSPSFERADVCDAPAMDRLFSKYGFSAVIHLAGLKAVGESVRSPLKYYRSNIDGLLTVLECMSAHGVKQLVYSSSATVYGNAEPPVSEDAPTGDCTNPYARTKCMAESIIRDCAAADASFSAALLRYFNPVGAHESGLIGEDPPQAPANLMPLLRRAAESGEPLTVFGADYPTPDRTGVRDYIHIMDLAEGHMAALKYVEGHTGAEAVNLGTGRGTGVLTLIHEYERVNGVKVPYIIAERRAGDVAESFADVEKAARLFGWRAKRGVAEMCRSACLFSPESGRGEDGHAI